MALSSTTYTGQAGLQTYLIGFAYLNPTYVHVFVDEIETVDFTITTDLLSIVIGTPAILGGEVILIQRQTDIEDDERLVDYESGAALTEDNLDTSDLQQWHAIQELTESGLGGGGGGGGDLPTGVEGGILTWDDGPDPLVIPPGTSGQFLMTQGPGALPAWATAPGSGGGEANTASNEGTGAGWFHQKVGVDLRFKSAVAGAGISISSSTTEVTISATGGGGGEANTASNTAPPGGVGVFAQKVGVDLTFKALVAGTAITLTPASDRITIASTGEANTASNVGASGVGPFDNKTGVDLRFRKADGPSGGGIGVTLNGQKIDFQITSTGVANEPSPTTGHLLLGFVAGVLRTFDVGNLPTGGGGSTLPVVDTTSIVKDPLVASQQMRIDVGAVAASTVRVLFMPDQDVNLTPNTGTFPAALHASRHAGIGADPIALDTLGVPSDNTNLNATTIAHGLCRKGSGVATEYLDGTLQWTTPAGGGGGTVTGDSFMGNLSGSPAVPSALTSTSQGTTNPGTTSQVIGFATTSANADLQYFPVINLVLNNQISNAKLIDMPGWSLKVRNAVTAGDPEDVQSQDVTTDGTAASGKFLLGWDAGTTGQLRKYDQANFIGSAPTLTNDSLYGNPAHTGTAIASAITAATLAATTPLSSSLGLGFTSSASSADLSVWTIESMAASTAVVRKAISLAALRVVEVGLNTAPGSPADGDAHILGSSQTAATAWTGQSGNTIAVFRTVLSGWEFYAPADGQKGHVTSGATHHFKTSDIAYSALEALWYPTTELWVTTEHWTGKYYLGTTEKIFVKCFTGNLTASSTTTDIPHGVTRDTNFPSRATGFLNASPPNVHIAIPQDMSSLVIVMQVNNANIAITHNSSASTTRLYFIRMEYAL